MQCCVCKRPCRMIVKQFDQIKQQKFSSSILLVGKLEYFGLLVLPFHVVNNDISDDSLVSI